MSELVYVMLGVGWSGLLAMLGAVALGQLVPGSWKERAEGWKTSYEREKESSDRQRAMVERAQMSSEIADKTAAAIASLLHRQEANKE